MRMTRVDPAVGKTKGTMENWRETFLKWYVLCPWQKLEENWGKKGSNYKNLTMALKSSRGTYKLPQGKLAHHCNVSNT